MAKKGPADKRADKTSTRDTRVAAPALPARAPGRPSSLIDTRVIYCGDCHQQRRKLGGACVDWSTPTRRQSHAHRMERYWQ